MSLELGEAEPGEPLGLSGHQPSSRFRERSGSWGIRVIEEGTHTHTHTRERERTRESLLTMFTTYMLAKKLIAHTYNLPIPYKLQRFLLA